MTFMWTCLLQIFSSAVLLELRMTTYDAYDRTAQIVRQLFRARKIVLGTFEADFFKSLKRVFLYE